MDIYQHANLDRAVGTIKSRAQRTCYTWGRAVQARMRTTADWQDRNGPSMTGYNARESLQVEVGLHENGDIQIVARSDRQTLTPWRGWQGAPVAAFLELGTRYMHRHPVIYTTVHAMAPTLRSMLVKDIRELSL